MEAGIVFFLICCSSFLGPSMGVYDGELNYCPPTPNCVSSQSSKYNPIHFITGYEYTGKREDAYNTLYQYLNDKENVSIRSESKLGYIRAFYFTKVFRFPDKVEFFFPEDSNRVQIRSASVFGVFDAFHNRIRLELIRRDLGWIATNQQ